MLKVIEFSTILSDNTRIEIPVHLQSQLKVGQAIRVLILFDEEVKEVGNTNI